MKAYMTFHFWGNYSAKILVYSPDKNKINKVFEALKFEATCPVHDACGQAYKAPGWKQSEIKDASDRSVYGVYGWFAGEDLEKATAQIKAIKGGEKIDSMANSIDHGPLCTLEID